MGYPKLITLVLILSLLVALNGAAQQTNGTLAVANEGGITLPQITQKLAVASPDTNKVKLLIKQSHLYWYAKSDKNNFLDSSRFAAILAHDLSAKNHYTPGSNEANFMMCRTSIEKGDIEGAMAVVSKVFGEERVRILLTIGEHFVIVRELHDQNDKAYSIIKEAINTSQSIGSRSWYYEFLLLLGKYYFVKGDLSKGKKVILQIIGYCDRDSNFASEARYWSELGLYMPKTPGTFQDVIHSHAMAIRFYLKAGNKKEAAYSLRDKAMANLVANQLDSAEQDGLEVFSMLHAMKEKPSFQTYRYMSNIYQVKGNFPKALNYALDALRKSGPLTDQKKFEAEILLGVIYDELDQPEKALPYYKAACNYLISVNDYEIFFWKYRQIDDQIKTGDTKNALQQFIAMVNKLKPATSNQKEIVAAGYGDLYFALKDFKKAETYYREMIEQDGYSFAESKKLLGYDNNIHGSKAFYKIGGFYLERGAYAIARPYLLKALTGPNSSGVQEKSNIEFSLFKADSALGAYQSAIRHFERSRNLKDSMFNATKSRQISELEIQYQTGQRDKSFLALKNQSIVQNQELERGRLEKNITLAGTAMLLVIAGLAYNGYRNKKRSNLKLTNQQIKINDQNHKLQNLVADKDKLLTEKDWLLKEIHHRVKNNLQIVMGLLQQQASFINNKEGLAAIQNIEHRMHSIALIHHKLYHSNTFMRVNIITYIDEMIGYLKDGFALDERIRFEKQVANIDFEVNIAVPMGLILNEAITNAIKYAFPGNKHGVISVNLDLIADNCYLLQITDDGSGLPPGFDAQKVNSIGFNLMRGLSKQLGGTFTVVNDIGVAIKVTLRDDLHLT